MFRLIFILLSLFSFSYSKIHITVTLPVQKNFIEKISKDEFSIHVIKDEYKKFDIKNKQRLDRLAYSKIYYTFGLEEEKEFIGILKSINKSLIIYDLTRNIKKDFTNGKLNPYIWLDPLKVRDISKNILEQLVILEPYKKKFFQENYNSFLYELDKHFLYIKRRLDKSESYNIFVYEPFWHYFAKRFRLNLYYKENRYTMIDEISSIIKESRKNDIRKLLILKNSSYEQARSLVSHINASIIEHDIEEYDWRKSLYFLTREITKK
jgi:zinc transport system substrate-binding protein